MKSIKEVLTLKAMAARQADKSKPDYELDRMMDDLDEFINTAIEKRAAQEKAIFIDRLYEMNGEEPFPQKAYITISNESKANDSKIKALETKLGRLPAIKKELTRRATGAQVTEAAAQAGAINPEIVAQLIQDKLETSMDDAGNVSIAPRVGGTIKDFIELTKANPEYKHLFGAGPFSKIEDKARPSTNTTINPWKKEAWNLTAQGEIFKRDPELAARMKAEVTPVRWDQ